MSSNNIPTRVAELSATLNSIKDYKGASYITGDMIEEAEDYNSYNASFYCDGWVKPIYEGDYRGVLLQKVEEFQVLRFYYICTRLEGLAYDEIPENWEDEGAPDIPEMEITDTIEFRQIWFSRTEQYTINIEELINEHYNDETFVSYIDSIQDWAFEPRYRKFILDHVKEHHSWNYTDGSALSYMLSNTGELLAKHAPYFSKCIQDNQQTDDAIRLYRTFKVAIRHHYQLPTTETLTRLYIDYLKMLELANVCMTEPYYICPNDITQAHDALVAERDRINEEAEKRKAEELEPNFALHHSWLFGIEFDTEEYHFQSLDSVEAYRIEGKIMHHCVYRCHYYDKHDVLTMHISDHEGNRVATCSVNLSSRKIVELQTICNDAHWREGDEYKEIWNILVARMHTLPKKKKEKLNIKKIA